MASGSFTGTTSSTLITPTITWSSTTNTAGNYSTVTAKLTYSRNNTGYTTYGTWIGSLTINGNTANATKVLTITYNSNTVAITHTVTVNHNSDGAKSITISATGGMESTSLTSTTISKTVALDTIPRATTPTLSSSSVDMGTAVTINTPRASTSFTHDLAYSFAGGSYVNIASGVTTSYVWTVPDLASSIPNSTAGTVTIRCITKSGTTTIGTKTVAMTAKVPASVVPTISAVALSEATAGLAAQFDAFIYGKSTIKAAITAAGASGSTIAAYSTTFDGKIYTGASWTSSTVNTNGSVSMVTTVTDSRGRTATKTTTIQVLAYSKPVVAYLQVYRINTDQETDSEGTGVAVHYTYSVTALNNKNTASMELSYKRSTDTDWTTMLTGSALSASTTVKKPAQGLSTDYQYDFKMTVTDWFGASSTYSAVLPSGAVILDIGADGKSLAVGKTAELPETFDSAWIIKGRHGELPRDAMVLKATDDLDDYTTPGFYTFSSAASATIMTKPPAWTTNASGSLEVFREGEGTQVRQVLTRCAANREIWERLYYSGEWQAWRPVYKGGTGRLLWTGGIFMQSGQQATLLEKISDQPNGIVLVFSRYSSDTVRDTNFNHFFVHKAFVAAQPGVTSTFMMTADGNFSVMAAKVLTINDTSIVGNAQNTATGSGSGVTYANNGFVLRYVIGV